LFCLAEAQLVAEDIVTHGGLEKKDFELEMGKIGSMASIRFIGVDERASAQRVRKVLMAQRIGAREWRQYTVQTYDAGLQPMRVNPDKNSKTISTEIAAKKLLEVLATQAPSKKFFASRDVRGEIQHQWVECLKLDLTSRTCARILWKGEGSKQSPSSLGLDKSAVESAFQDLFGASDTTPWV
jgi:hypothetical protein